MTSTNYDPRVLKALHPVPGAPDNWKRFFTFNTDAKVIGIQYIVTGLCFLFLGGWTMVSASEGRSTSSTRVSTSGSAPCM